MKIKYGTQIILSKIPIPYNDSFGKEIQKKHFEDFKKNINNVEEYLYNPIKYYLLGEYDVCYITLINNLKFSHRVLGHNSNEGSSENIDEYNNSFVSYTSLLTNESINCKDYFYDNNLPSEYFVSIINLKVNNGLIIGNGLKIITLILRLIKEKVKEIDPSSKFILSYTLSWFELSLVVFVNDLSSIEKKLNMLRGLVFADLKKDIEEDNSLYDYFFKGDKWNASIFSDTHTHLGFNSKLVENKRDDVYVKKFYENFESVKLKTTIEWYVKPGHEVYLINELENSDYLKGVFKQENSNIALGRTDCIFKENKNLVLNNLNIIREIIKNENKTNILKHIRGLKTQVYLKTQLKGKKVDRSIMCLSDKIGGLRFDISKINELNVKLKSLKISRSIRQKVIKIFSNYNNGILDPVLFTYYLDFYLFLNELVSYIETTYENSHKINFTVEKIERHLKERINIFKDSYSVRFLNGYSFENITNFDVDYNVSVQQLLSAYTFFIKAYSEAFSYKNMPLVKINDNSTVSNYYSINYSLHHLTSPEFVFSTLTKEITNNIFHNKVKSFELLLNRYEEKKSLIIEEVDSLLFSEMVKSKSFHFEYFINDCVRFLFTFNLDPAKFYFWFWNYNLQNSSLFNVSGMFNEHHLRKEMLRFNLVLDFFNINNDFDCPVQEISSYWYRNEKKLSEISKLLINVFKKELNGTDKFGVNFNYITHTIDSLLESQDKKYPNLSIEEGAKVIEKVKKNIKEKYIEGRGVRGIENYEWYVYRKKQFLSKEIGNDFSIDFISDNFLDNIYEKNKKKVHTLKRSWQSGKNTDIFDDCYEAYSLIDQTGSVFFNNNDDMNSYFSDTAETLMRIIDFSLKEKKRFIVENYNM